MAKKVTVALVDDIDDTKKADETVVFEIDGVTYEIDLTNKHATKLRGELSDWIKHARRTRGRKRPGAGRSPEQRTRNEQIRTWLLRKGVPVGAKGRIAADLVALYDKANPGK